MVPEMGLEPISLAAHDFESCVYTIPPLRRIPETVARAYQTFENL